MRESIARISVALSFLALAACEAFAPPPENAEELALKLRKAGIRFDTAELMSFKGMKHARITEGIVLKGEHVHIEIIRMEHAQTYDIMSKVGPLLAVAEAAAGKEFPGKPEMFASRPFVVVVREEEQPGEVFAILRDVLGEEPE